MDENLKQEIEFIIKCNESLAGNKIKNKVLTLLLIYKNETMFMNTENSKTNKPYKFFLNLLQREVQINMLLFKTYLFITRGKI